MKILVDTHTHTIASDHAYSTIMENVRRAKELGLQGVAITDHGPALPDAPHPWHFDNIGTAMCEVDGVKVLCGAEVNILDADGTVDLPERTLSRLNLVIASMHRDTFAPATQKEHTQAYINALKNPYIDIIGHSGSPEYAYDMDAVLDVAKAENKLIEINNCTHIVRRASVENCMRIARLCMKKGIYIVVSSDAHFAPHVGRFNSAVQMLEEIGFPEELVANTTFDKLIKVLQMRQKPPKQ